MTKLFTTIARGEKDILEHIAFNLKTTKKIKNYRIVKCSNGKYRLMVNKK